MVHESFQIFEGRDIIIRVDDCTPQEREEVSRFLSDIRTTVSGNGTAEFLGILTGAISALLTFIVYAALVPEAEWSVAWALSFTSAVGLFYGFSVWAWKSMRWTRERPELHGRILNVVAHQPRCAIAFEQIRNAHPSYARILPASLAAQPAPAG